MGVTAKQALSNDAPKGERTFMSRKSLEFRMTGRICRQLRISDLQSLLRRREVSTRGRR